MSRFAYSCAAVGLIAGISATALPAGAQTPTYCEPDVGSPANLKTIKHGALEGASIRDGNDDGEGDNERHGSLHEAAGEEYFRKDD